MKTSILYFLSLIFLLAVPFSVQAQFSDDFSDGNLTNNPTWQGDLANFTVNGNNELQLLASEAGQSRLFTQTSFFDSTVWDFLVRLEFAPSGSNLLRIYLSTESSDFENTNGYMLECGESGSEDALNFFRLDNGSPTLLSKTTIGSMANDPAVSRVKIKRDITGDWTYSVDFTGGFNFEDEFTVSDNTYNIQDGFFGIECIYTDSRKDKYFFDDISVLPILPDTEAPELIAANAINANTVEVDFSEPLDEASATLVQNYQIDQGIGQPGNVSFSSANPTKVTLNLTNSLSSPGSYQLTISNIEDEAGNAASSQSTSFDFIEIEIAFPYEILINEIFADPTPQVSLPDAEFVELFNNSDKILDLSDYLFEDESGPFNLPSVRFNPGEYIILCDEDDVSSFSQLGKTVGIPSFPALTNGGEVLQIKTTSEEVIDAVQYSDQWHSDLLKRAGGWTLELVNPDAPCQGAENWKSSESLTGGTPGSANSVLASIPDLEGPTIIDAFPNSANSILVTFSEGLDAFNALQNGYYSINNGLFVNFAIPQPPLYTSVILVLNGTFQNGIIYTLTVDDMVTDCSGNALIGNKSINIALSERVEEGDILINEILFNPRTGGNDFVEIVNVSDKVFDLSTLQIANIQPDRTNLINIQAQKLIFPGEIIALTENRNNILENYIVPNPANLIETDLPGFADDFGNVTILRRDILGGSPIDAVDYSDAWHHPLLDDEDGVSLERISLDLPSQNANNWQSAAGTAGYATPTGENSQSQTINIEVEDFFELEPKTFSPDQDGREDFLSIFYKLDKDGYLATIRVFDSKGIEVKSILKNELLSQEGILKWEGNTDNGSIAPLGIYILIFEITHPEGTSKRFQKTCVLAKPLD
jgi:hypothetical protein